jgi:phospholipase/carboxylesterase
VQIETEPVLEVYKGWTLRVRRPVEKNRHLMLMIHGWMGDENSMWIFANHLPTNYTVIAPRGPIQAPEGGYSWREIKPGTWGKASMNELVPMVDRLIHLVDEWAEENGINGSPFDVMGFSQGAAMAYAIFLSRPERVRRAAALAGFIPEGGQAFLSDGNMTGKSIFISHGRADEAIPIEQARSALKMLKDAGVDVNYCESDMGHKVSRECMTEIKKYFAKF